jgi:hypothetical protein
MVGERVERRLAAILAADVAGYSRLMGQDEEGTLDALKALRKSLIDPKITEHRGRIVRTTEMARWQSLRTRCSCYVRQCLLITSEPVIRRYAPVKRLGTTSDGQHL